MSSSNTFDHFLDGFRETIASSTARLREVSEEQGRRRRSADAWAPIEVLGHLIDSAANNHQRFVRAQFTDDLVFSGYEQNQWVSSAKVSGGVVGRRYPTLERVQSAPGSRSFRDTGRCLNQTTFAAHAGPDRIQSRRQK